MYDLRQVLFAQAHRDWCAGYDRTADELDFSLLHPCHSAQPDLLTTDRDIMVTDEADVAEFQKVVGAYVDSVTTRYYNYLPKISNPKAGGIGPAKFSEIIIFQVRSGKNSDFRSGIDRIYEGTVKTKWPVNYEWYALANGGTAGTYVLSFPHSDWADFEDKPDAKPYREMLKEAFGQQEADSIVDRLDRSIEKETSEIIQFRPELSYLPAK